MRVRISFNENDVRHMAAYEHFEKRPKRTRGGYLVTCILEHEQHISLLDELSNVIAEQLKNASLTLSTNSQVKKDEETTELPANFLDEFANWG